MISLEVRDVAPGTCSWCGKDKNVVFDVAFSDGTLEGPLCINDFKCAVQQKVAASKKKVAKPSIAPSAGAA